LGFSFPSITEGEKGDADRLLLFFKVTLGKFMSSMYFIIFGVLQDFTPKMLGIAFQGL
jgi:hypothetical protein